jgi:hypothetical protein
MDPVVREQYESGNTIVCIGTHEYQGLENYMLFPLEIEIDYTTLSCGAATLSCGAATLSCGAATLSCEAATLSCEAQESRVRSSIGPKEYTISLDDYRTDPVTLESYFGEGFYLFDGCDALEFINEELLKLDLEQRHACTTTMIYAAIYRRTPWTPQEIKELGLANPQ